MGFDGFQISDPSFGGRQRSVWKHSANDIREIVPGKMNRKVRSRSRITFQFDTNRPATMG